MTQSMMLANHLLVAMPSHIHNNFEHAVIYVCEHRQEGAVGLIINQPLQYPMSLIFDQLHIQGLTDEISNQPLLFGGPLQTERGFVIHRPSGHWRSSIALLDDQVAITTSNDIIRAIADNSGPKEVLIALGYVGWREQKLEQEIIEDAWLVCPFSAGLLYDVPFDQRWLAAGKILGVDMNQIISDGGHA